MGKVGFPKYQADVAKLANAQRSGRCGIYPLWVQLPPSAHTNIDFTPG
jgi:hypothetical protein